MRKEIGNFLEVFICYYLQEIDYELSNLFLLFEGPQIRKNPLKVTSAGFFVSGGIPRPMASAAVSLVSSNRNQRVRCRPRGVTIGGRRIDPHGVDLVLE